MISVSLIAGVNQIQAKVIQVITIRRDLNDLHHFPVRRLNFGGNLLNLTIKTSYGLV
jgi:hypothetical protein